MKKILKIKKSNGSILGIYDDAIPFKKLGKPKVERVSNIEYDNDSEKWTVTMTHDGETKFSTETRNGAYEQEVEMVNKNIDELAEKHFGK